ncbi:SCO2400 family protein, partial [Streptomyces caniscabiei]|uniref:SCO2400 family protein n=1 Tax=Streptomyces caniscabiei TaxID=2746961 RepID=UPI000A853BBB
MDYCHPCRRHLNGALACPGCGTPVEELRAYADDAAYRRLGISVSSSGAGV